MRGPVCTSMQPGSPQQAKQGRGTPIQNSLSPVGTVKQHLEILSVSGQS